MSVNWRKLRSEERKRKRERANDHQHFRIGSGPMLVFAAFSGWLGWDPATSAMATFGVACALWAFVAAVEALEDGSVR